MTVVTAFVDAATMRALVRGLQDAHAGELAAAYAYRAHWKSLRRRPAARREVKRIEAAEWHHRALVASMLAELGEHPRQGRELLMAAVGRFFGTLCYVGGFFGPMYAAGQLEAMNVAQYDTARDQAAALGLGGFAEQLEAMRVEEDVHERFFAGQIRSHRLVPIARFVFGWDPAA
jgi:demethoxyubiquinone hydroxylase (CLK1/Coq7/Cat5 family)